MFNKEGVMDELLNMGLLLLRYIPEPDPFGSSHTVFDLVKLVLTVGVVGFLIFHLLLNTKAFVKVALALAAFLVFIAFGFMGGPLIAILLFKLEPNVLTITISMLISGYIAFKVYLFIIPDDDKPDGEQKGD